jgi:Uma2 family endonuclease
MSAPATVLQEAVYPDSDGQPMAENTLQFEWIVTIKGGLDALFQDRPDVFVAGDLLWYPVEGRPDIRRAPDAMVAIGRPKGYRGSYRQWQEADLAPQVVFEVLSPGNRVAEMAQKQAFYDRYGVEEYYLYDPEEGSLAGWQRRDGKLQVIEPIVGWVSPQLGIRFEMEGAELRIIRPDGERFLTYIELDQQRREAEEQRREAEEQRREAEEQRRKAEERSAAMAVKLRELGINPDDL